MIRQNIILRFPEGKKKAVTLSYDDGVDQDQHLIELLKQYNMKGTFNISSDWLSPEGTVYPEGETHRRMSVSQCIQCYDPKVCEVAAHAYTHPWGTTLPTAMMMEQVIEDRKKLEDMFHVIIKGMAYPYGMYNDDVVEILRLAGIKYCRTVNETHEFYIPEDWLRLNPTCHHDDPMLDELVERFLNEDYYWSSSLFYLWGHTFEFERNDNWDVMDKFMKKVSGREDIWYATNIEVFEYVQAYKRLEYSVDGKQIYNPTVTKLWIEIDGKMIEIPAGGYVTC